MCCLRSGQPCEEMQGTWEDLVLCNGSQIGRAANDSECRKECPCGYEENGTFCVRQQPSTAATTSATTDTAVTMTKSIATAQNCQPFNSFDIYEYSEELQTCLPNTNFWLLIFLPTGVFIIILIVIVALSVRYCKKCGNCKSHNDSPENPDHKLPNVSSTSFKLVMDLCCSGVSFHCRCWVKLNLICRSSITER